MRREIPSPVIAILADYLSKIETHASLDNLFLYADAPGDVPEGSKIVKTQKWLRRINEESEYPLIVLGKLIENYFEKPELNTNSDIFEISPIPNPRRAFAEQIKATLKHHNLSYINNNVISAGESGPSHTLADFIKGKDIPAINAEFTRALDNINSHPRESISAACNILESIFKTYIEDENLTIPRKQDLQNVWKIVRDDLNFDPSKVQDNDIQKILTGIISIVDGIGAYRTHASSAHGQGRNTYLLKPYYARLAVHSAHTIALFVMETWDEKRTEG